MQGILLVAAGLRSVNMKGIYSQELEWIFHQRNNADLLTTYFQNSDLQTDRRS